MDEQLYYRLDSCPFCVKQYNSKPLYLLGCNQPVAFVSVQDNTMAEMVLSLPSINSLKINGQIICNTCKQLMVIMRLEANIISNTHNVGGVAHNFPTQIEYKMTVNLLGNVPAEAKQEDIVDATTTVKDTIEQILSDDIDSIL